MVVLPDYPSVSEDRQRAASELDRLAELGKIHWYENGSYPPDLRVCPSHLIVKGDKARVAHDWSRAAYPLDSALTNPPAQYGGGGLAGLIPPLVGGAGMSSVRRSPAPFDGRTGCVPLPPLWPGPVARLER